MKRKLIAMDLDGTAVDSRGRLAPGVREAILAAREAKHLAVFVTGRADTDMAPLDCAYEFVDYLILNNGSKLVRGKDHKVLANEMLDRDEVERLIRFCQENALQVYLISGTECYASMRSDRLTRYMSSIGVHPLYFKNIGEVPTHRVEGMTILGEAVLACAAVKDNGFALRPVISEPCCVDVLNPTVNKWNGLERLLEMVGIDREDVVAVGDYDNDLEMILRSGIGVAVGNARDCVKSRADYVTVRDNESGAVADMINELVLGRASGLCIRNAGRS